MIALVLLGIVACGGLPPVGVHPLVTVELRGGMCPAGACESVVTLRSDGTVTGDAKPPNVLGRMTPAVLARLQAAIAATDVQRLGAKPFTGICPTAFDGQEAVFTFHLATGEVRLASCEVELDLDAPIFRAVQEAMQAGVGPSN